MNINKPNLIKPKIFGDSNIWGEKLNENIDKQDTFYKAVVSSFDEHEAEISSLDRDKVSIIDVPAIVTPVMNNYFESVIKPNIDDYVETDSKPNIDSYVETDSKPNIDSYVESQKAEIDNYVEDISKGDIDNYTEEEKEELDLYEKAKEEELEAYSKLMERDITYHADEEIERLLSHGIDGITESIHINTGIEMTSTTNEMIEDSVVLVEEKRSKTIGQVVDEHDHTISVLEKEVSEIKASGGNKEYIDEAVGILYDEVVGLIDSSSSDLEIKVDEAVGIAETKLPLSGGVLSGSIDLGKSDISFTDTVGGGSVKWTIGSTEVANLSATSTGLNITSTNLICSGNVTAFSDIKLKKDLEIIPKALYKIECLNGYTYTRKNCGRRESGVVAQEVEKVLPEVIVQHEDEKGEITLSVAYGNMVGLLIEGIKELSSQNRILEERLARIEGEMRWRP
ncbi:MAG: tail fiber domain-containing protein [Cetobacterium sp.]